MKKFATIIIGLFLFIAGCMKVIELPQDKRGGVLLPEDLKIIGIIPDYSILKTSKGISNLFVHSKWPTGDKGFLASTSFTTTSSTIKVQIRTQTSKTSSVERAIELFNISKKLGYLYKSDIFQITASTYDVEQAFCINSKDRFYFLIRKGEFVISYDVEGMSMDEAKVRNMIRDKIIKYIASVENAN